MLARPGRRSVPSSRSFDAKRGLPHFHATYAGQTVVISIETGEVIAGVVPPRALRLVAEWLELHRDKLRLNWVRAREATPLVRIDPLP